MTRADKLRALAERVMRLEGPDREVDAAIYHDVLGYCRHSKKTRSGYQDDTGFDCDDCGADSWGNTSKPPWPVGQRLHFVLPAFTARLDAAMTLVPEGKHFHIMHAALSAMDRRYDFGRYVRTEVDGSFAEVLARHVTAAALLARAEQEQA